MILKLRRKCTTTETIQHRNVVASLFVFIAEVLITAMLSRGNSASNIGKLYRPLVATTWAWIPQRHHHGIRRYIPCGGHELDGGWRHTNIHWDGSVVTTPSRRYSSNTFSKSSTTSIQGEERKDSDDVVIEATNMAMSICGDDLSVRASSTFGGLKYYNTDIDNRFRVLFVLGGPGNYQRYGNFLFLYGARFGYSHTWFDYFSLDTIGRIGKRNTKCTDGAEFSRCPFFGWRVVTECTGRFTT